MPARVSETFVLRTYPFREADLIVSFFTRDLGKLRGVARRARRPKSAFGSGLERLSHVRMAYFQRENSELANLSGCELIESQFALQSDYGCSRGAGLFYGGHRPIDAAARAQREILPAPQRHAGGLCVPAAKHVDRGGLLHAVGRAPDGRAAGNAREQPETVEIVEEMFVKKLADLTPRDWTKATCRDCAAL